MLQKGIIEKLEGKNFVRVRVPKYDKLSTSDSGTSTEDLPVGIICALPEMNVTYSIGDVVLVAYENDELNKPVILGLLQRNADTQSTTEIAYAEAAIDEINDKLTTLENKDMHMHVKYSNDNGATFTSLFDFDTLDEDEVTFNAYSPEAIEIDPETKQVQWGIIDSNNVNVTQDFNIETTIQGENSKTGFTLYEVFTDTLFETPVLLKACDKASITFIIKSTLQELSEYYVSLSTDKINIGDAYGDYVGIFVSNEVNASLNTSDYTWTSTKERNRSFVNNTTNSILDRVRQNERDLRGYSEDILDNSGQIVTSNLGLLDAINVNLDNIIVGLGRNNIYFSNYNQYIDSGSSSLHINSLTQQEFNLERYAIVTTYNNILHSYEEVKPKFDPTQIYYTYDSDIDDYVVAENIDHFEEGETYYTREGEEEPYTYLEVKPKPEEGVQYYIKNSEDVETPVEVTEFEEGVTYYVQVETSEIITNSEPHLRLTFTLT